MGRKVIIVRHGETQGNQEGRFQIEEIPLSDRGNEQAKLVAKRIQKEYGRRVRKIVSSDLRRAKETATHIFEALSDVEGLPFETHPILQERNFGDLRGQLIREVMATVNLMEPEYRPSNGESFNDFDKRMEKAFDFIRSQAKVVLESDDEEGVMIVVTHGLVKTRLAKNHFDHGEEGFPPKGHDRFIFQNTSVTIVDVDESREKAKVLRINCVEHLPRDLQLDLNEEQKKLNSNAVGSEQILKGNGISKL